jgi:Fur family ferric uptake transcriptional regulator
MRTAIILGVSGWAEHADATLRKTGHRTGGARAAVLELLARQDCCLTAGEIHERLRDEGRRVGIASVYRVLEQLGSAHLVQRVEVGDGVVRYEPAYEDHHHHVVCDDCGKVEPFHDDTLERAIGLASDRLDYAVSHHEVVLRGACGDCRAT